MEENCCTFLKCPWVLLFDRPVHKPVWTRSQCWKHCSIHEGACIVKLQGLTFRSSLFSLFEGFFGFFFSNTRIQILYIEINIKNRSFTKKSFFFVTDYLYEPNFLQTGETFWQILPAFLCGFVCIQSSQLSLVFECVIMTHIKMEGAGGMARQREKMNSFPLPHTLILTWTCFAAWWHVVWKAMSSTVCASLLPTVWVTLWGYHDQSLFILLLVLSGHAAHTHSGLPVCWQNLFMGCKQDLIWLFWPWPFCINCRLNCRPFEQKPWEIHFKNNIWTFQMFHQCPNVCFNLCGILDWQGSCDRIEPRMTIVHWTLKTNRGPVVSIHKCKMKHIYKYIKYIYSGTWNEGKGIVAILRIFMR